jgi:hypothetical protein
MKSQAEILKLERLNVLFKGFDGGAGQIYLAGAKNPLKVNTSISAKPVCTSGGNAVRTLKHRLKYLYERKQEK